MHGERSKLMGIGLMILERRQRNVMVLGHPAGMNEVSAAGVTLVLQYELMAMRITALPQRWRSWDAANRAALPPTLAQDAGLQWCGPNCGDNGRWADRDTCCGSDSTPAAGVKTAESKYPEQARQPSR